MTKRRWLMLGLFLMIVVVLIYRQHHQKMLVIELEQAKVLTLTCKLDMALDRETYSVRSKDPDTWNMLKALMEKLPKDQEWVATTDNGAGKFYYAGKRKWRGEEAYETFIWLCESKDAAEVHLNFIEQFASLKKLDIKSYRLVN